MGQDNENLRNTIARRITEEHKKYAKFPDMDWAGIAAGKIVMELDEMFVLFPRPTEQEKKWAKGKADQWARNQER